VKVLLSIPVHRYYKLLASCEPSSAEYRTLIDLMPVSEKKLGQHNDVHIRCHTGEVKSFLAWAARIDPNVMDEIRIEESFISKLISIGPAHWVSLLGLAILIGGIISLAINFSDNSSPQLGIPIIVCGFAIIIAGEMMD